jgi:hypothetical protein
MSRLWQFIFFGLYTYFFDIKFSLIRKLKRKIKLYKQFEIDIWVIIR